MPQARFFVDAALAEGDETPLPPEVAHHAVRVLRLREGDPVTVFNGSGGEFSAHLSVQGARAWANLERFDPIERESPLAVTLVQAWVATDKLEWIVEKAVELGVTDITLVPDGAQRGPPRRTSDGAAARAPARDRRRGLLPERAQQDARHHGRHHARAGPAGRGRARRARHRARSPRRRTAAGGGQRGRGRRTWRSAPRAASTTTSRRSPRVLVIVPRAWVRVSCAQKPRASPPSSSFRPWRATCEQCARRAIGFLTPTLPFLWRSHEHSRLTAFRVLPAPSTTTGQGAANPLLQIAAADASPATVSSEDCRAWHSSSSRPASAPS